MNLEEFIKWYRSCNPIFISDEKLAEVWEDIKNHSDKTEGSEEL